MTTITITTTTTITTTIITTITTTAIITITTIIATTTTTMTAATTTAINIITDVINIVSALTFDRAPEFPTKIQYQVTMFEIWCQ